MSDNKYVTLPVSTTGPDYLVTGWGETDRPEIMIVPTLEDAKEALVAMCYDDPESSEAHTERESLLDGLNDDSDLPWKREFEIGGISVEQVYLKIAAAPKAEIAIAANAGGQPEVEAEHFIQAAIDRAPEPLRRLGEFLGRVLDEDQWKTAERLLLSISAAHTPTACSAGGQELLEAPLFDVLAIHSNLSTDAMDELAPLLAAQALRTMNRSTASAAAGQAWISVADHLPKTDIECTSRELMVSTTMFVRGVSIDGGEGICLADYQDDGKWHCYGGDYDFMHITEVTHWAPITRHTACSAEGQKGGAA